MSVCIACGLKPRKCECFGPRPKAKLHRYTDYEIKAKSKEKLPGVNVHGNGGYANGCRCEECRQGHNKYYMENKQRIHNSRRARYLKTGK